MVNSIRKVLKNKKGATMVEYAILVALLSVAAIVSIQAIGTKLNTRFTTVSTTL